MNNIFLVLNENFSNHTTRLNAIKQSKKQIRASKTKSKSKLLKKLDKETIQPIESWTTHGLPNIIRSKYITIKIVWTILFLAALGVSIYFLTNTIKDYLDFKVTTVVRSINVDDEIEFPIITICNSNLITNEAGLDYFKIVLNESDISYDHLVDILYNETNDKNYYLIFTQQVMPFQFFYKTQIEDRQNLSSTIDEMFVDGNLNNQNVTSSDFKWIFNPYYGNCYQLNTDSKWKAQVYQNNYLNLMFYLDLPDIVNEFGMKKSLFVLISSRNSNPFRNLDNIINVPTGSQSLLTIHKSVFNKQKRPYSNCDFIEDENGNFDYPSSFNRKYYDQIKQAGYEYSQSMCISFCQIDMIGRNCSLRISSMNAPNNMNNFCPNNELNVLEDIIILEEMYNQQFCDKSMDLECAKRCPLECTTESYQVDLRNIDIKFTDLDLDPNDIVYLSIYFGSLSYLNYDESPSVTVYNLVSNIGGVIGLLLGFISVTLTLLT